MRSKVPGLVILAAVVAWAPAGAECLPTPCFVESVVVESCFKVDGEAVRRGKEMGLTDEQVREILSRQPGLLVRGKPVESRAVARCGEPSKPRLEEGQTARLYLVRSKSCSDFRVGSVVEGLAREPCCDVFPAWTLECVMLIETLGPIPDWAVPPATDPK